MSPIHGCTNGSSGKQYVIDQDDLEIRNMKRDVRFLEDGLIFANGQIIPIQRNVQLPQDNLRLLNFRDQVF